MIEGEDTLSCRIRDEADPRPWCNTPSLALSSLRRGSRFSLLSGLTTDENDRLCSTIPTVILLPNEANFSTATRPQDALTAQIHLSRTHPFSP
jgi:hypothetical protein